MRWIYIIITIILLTSLTAGTSYVFQKDNPVDLKISCFDINNTLCNEATSCQVTINYPNSTNLIKNKSMTYNENYFNYTLNENQTTANGEHSVVVTCTGTADGFATFKYEINPTGIRATTQRTESITRSIYIIFGIGILFFFAFMFFNGSLPIRWTFLIFAFIFILIGINVVFVSLQDEVVNPKLESLFSFITASSFYLYWFAGGLLMIMWFMTFFNTYFYKKNLNNARRYGLS